MHKVVLEDIEESNAEIAGQEEVLRWFRRHWKQGENPSELETAFRDMIREELERHDPK
jgi:hypothetical protein